MPKPRISYVPLEQMTPEMREEIERCARARARPGPRARGARARTRRVLFFADSWKELFREGIVDHPLKELCRVYISRTTKCEYCGRLEVEQLVVLPLLHTLSRRSERWLLPDEPVLLPTELIVRGSTAPASPRS